MDRPAHDYAAAMAFAAQQQQQQQFGAAQQQQQQFGFPPQHQQFPPSVHGPPFIPPNASLQQYPFPRHMQQPHGLHPHLPAHHPHLHLQQPPSAFPPHMPPPFAPPPFHGPFDSAPPPAPPPSDPELQKVIDKLVEYSAKNGPEFEAMIREKQQENPAYSFLFGGEGHSYYRYKLWLSTHSSGSPFNQSLPSSSMSMLRPPPSPMMSPSPLNAPPLGGPIMHQPPFAPPFYEQQHHHHSQVYAGPARPDYDQSSRAFKGLSGPLPSDVAMELNDVLNNLTGTKESIKGAKIWFMQRSPFAPALAEALCDRLFAVDDPERQLHIIYLANDILFDSLQRRINLHDLDNEALAFKPVLGPMLARVYHNPQNTGENQSRLQKILQFWGSKEVYDHDTICSLEKEMIGGSPSNLFTGPSKELSATPTDTATAGLRQQPTILNASHWQPDRQGPLLNMPEQPDKLVPPAPPSFPGSSMPISSSAQPATHQQLQSVPQSAINSEKLPPYPLFPPGLIPGMVRKMQIGSGVPYSPMSPLDIPTMIPPSNVSESEILDRVSKFFKEIGEVNPSEGPMKLSSDSKDDYDEYERDSPVRKGGACIPPPPNLQVDPETGAYADGSVDRKSNGRLGLGASANPNEESQYDDVYTSYRKQRSTNYHSSISARAATAR